MKVLLVVLALMAGLGEAIKCFKCDTGRRGQRVGVVLV